MNKLAAFYTQDVISRLLVERLSFNKPKSIVDLGIGNGSLTLAAYERWRDATFYASDVDAKVQRYVKENLPFVKFILSDGLNRSLPQRLLLDGDLVDVAICNPPYLRLKKNKNHIQLFKEASLYECQNLSVITTDLVFLAQNLRMLKRGGEMGIILPEGLLTNHSYEKFRESLLHNHNIKGIISLPPKVFKKTEAKTHIVIIEKGISCQEYIPIMSADNIGNLSEEIIVKSSRLIDRMDYNHYDWSYQSCFQLTKVVNLELVVVSISRGSLSFKELRSTNYDYLHSTNLFKKQLANKRNLNEAKKLNKVKKGEIVMVRVGRNNIGKFVVIERGEYVISDCLFRIIPKPEYREKIIDSLNSEYGKSWLKGYSHGVCAKVISKKDLLKFPIKL